MYLKKCKYMRFHFIHIHTYIYIIHMYTFDVFTTTYRVISFRLWLSGFGSLCFHKDYSSWMQNAVVVKDTIHVAKLGWDVGGPSCFTTRILLVMLYRLVFFPPARTRLQYIFIRKCTLYMCNEIYKCICMSSYVLGITNVDRNTCSGFPVDIIYLHTDFRNT